MTYYLFSPKIGEDGKQEVRIPNYGEWFDDKFGNSLQQRHSRIHTKHPILTMKKFETLEELKEYINGLVWRRTNDRG